MEGGIFYYSSHNVAFATQNAPRHITFVLPVRSLKRSTSLFKDSIRQQCLAWIIVKSPYLPVLTLFFF